MIDNYPQAGYIFILSFPDMAAINEGSFQEVSGLSVKLGTEELKEGGENKFVYRLPDPPKYENLVLRRGILSGPVLIKWTEDAIQKFNFSLKEVVISLLNENLIPIASWKFQNAYPVGINISEIKIEENAIVIERLEFAYDYFIRVV